MNLSSNLPDQIDALRQHLQHLHDQTPDRETAEALRQMIGDVDVIYRDGQAFISAVSNTEAFLEMMVDSAKDFAIFALDIERRVTFWSEGAERVFGYSEREMMGQSGDAIFTPEDRDAGIPQQEVEQALKEGYALDERWHLCKNGQRIFVSGTMRPVKDPGGNVHGLLKVTHNITKRKLEEDERAELLRREQEARRKAEALNNLQLKFTAMISHELRTPLTSIKGFASTLLASEVEYDSKTQRQFVTIIDEEADKLTNLIGQLLDVARFETGTFRIYPQEQHLQVVFDVADAQLKTLTAEHPLTINLPSQLPLLNLDTQRIAQVLVNLVSNSVRFSPPGSPITIDVAEHADFVQVDTRDSGIGIPASLSEAVFEAFYQPPTTGTSTYHKGVGLGLAICRGIIDAHGGRIWVNPDLEKGTMISFTLPKPEGAAN